jgi:hypothetical protein
MNSIEQLLFVVKRQTESKFLIMCGEARTLERTRGHCVLDKECGLIDVVAGSDAPLPTMIDEGLDDKGG